MLIEQISAHKSNFSSLDKKKISISKKHEGRAHGCRKDRFLPLGVYWAKSSGAAHGGSRDLGLGVRGYSSLELKYRYLWVFRI